MSVIGRHFKLSQLAGIFLTLDEKHKYVNYYTEISLNSKAEDKSEFLLIISVFIGKNHSLFNLQRTLNVEQIIERNGIK